MGPRYTALLTPVPARGMGGNVKDSQDGGAGVFKESVSPCMPHLGLCGECLFYQSNGSI